MFSKKQKAEAFDGLLKYLGLPPYDGAGNPCCEDGYFAASLERRYGMSLEELDKEIGFSKRVSKWNRAKELADQLLRNPYE